VTAQRVSSRTFGGERARNGLAPDLEEAPVTATEKFTCPSCGQTGQPSPLPNVCRSCESAAVGGAEGVARFWGGVVRELAEEVAVLELQVEELVDQLDEAGYLQLADNDSDALFVALADADETQRAREVLAAHEDLFEDQDDVALALEEAAAVMAEHERCAGSCPSTSGPTATDRCRR
jgi:hypothetical protein